MIKFDPDKIAFYDIEVLPEVWTIIFKNRKKEVIGKFVNNCAGLNTFISKHIVCGWNNYFYDDKILSHIIRTNGNVREVKRLNDLIINGDSDDKQLQHFIRKRYPIRKDLMSIDVKSEIVAGDKLNWISLKMVEANMGLSIVESEVGFNDVNLTDEQLEMLLSYNEYDVDAVIEIFNERFDYFENHHMLVEEAIKHRISDKWRSYWDLYKKTETTLVGYILENSYKLIIDWDDFKVPKDVIEYWKECYKIAMDDIKNGTYNAKSIGVYTKMIGACTFDFSIGGSHGVHQLKKYFETDEKGILKEPDVKSQYPTIAINYGLFGEKTETYVKYYKLKNDPGVPKKVQASVKPILNKAYGATGNIYNKLWNKAVGLYICFRGQEILWNMANAYSEIAEIIMINTDGTMIKDIRGGEVYEENGVIKQYPTVEEISRRIEKEFNIQIDIPEFKALYQKDVNNYFALEADGTVFAKGKYAVNNAKNYFKDNNESIVNLAVQKKLLQGISFEETIEQNLDKPELFMYNNSISRLYAGIGFFPDVSEIDNKRDALVLKEEWKDYKKYNYSMQCIDMINIIMKNIKICNSSYLGDHVSGSEELKNKLQQTVLNYMENNIPCKEQNNNTLYKYMGCIKEEILKQEEFKMLVLPEKLHKIEPKDFFNNNNLIGYEKGRVTRTYAVKATSSLKKGMLRKVKVDEEGNFIAFHAFPSTSNCVAIFNNGIIEHKEVFKNNVDLNYYIKRAQEVLQIFKGK